MPRGLADGVGLPSDTREATLVLVELLESASSPRLIGLEQSAAFHSLVRPVPPNSAGATAARARTPFFSAPLPSTPARVAGSTRTQRVGARKQGVQNRWPFTSCAYANGRLANPLCVCSYDVVSDPQEQIGAGGGIRSPVVPAGCMKCSRNAHAVVFAQRTQAIFFIGPGRFPPFASVRRLWASVRAQLFQGGQ